MGGGVASSPEDVADFYAQAAGEGASEKFGLIEPSPEPSTPMEGNGDDEVVGLIERNASDHEVAERGGEGLNFGVLEEMDEVFQDAIVVAEGVGGIVAGKLGAAASADAVVIEGGVIEEGGTALGAEVIGGQGLRLG